MERTLGEIELEGLPAKILLEGKSEFQHWRVFDCRIEQEKPSARSGSGLIAAQRKSDPLQIPARFEFCRNYLLFGEET
jgi:hypothetical protein